jgi:hypothetical protein
MFLINRIKLAIFIRENYLYYKNNRWLKYKVLVWSICVEIFVFVNS